MKNKLTIILFLAIGMASFQSCKKDSSPAIASIKGRWDLTEVKAELFENNVSKQKVSEIYTKGELYYVFADTNFSLYEGDSLEEEGTYVYDSNAKTIKFIYSPNDSETIEVTTIDITNLIFGIEVSETNNGVTTKIVSEIIFKKG